MIKILIGGSPCTYWSVAQKKGREVEAEGLGWELFRNYLIAKEKFKPDFFLYENNKSAAQPIKDQISHELGVDLMHINSALVSAQNRQRFYALTDAERDVVERVVMAEAGGESFEGQMLVAQCILNAAEKRGVDPSEAVVLYSYTKSRPDPTQRVKDAVAAVFDRGETVVDEPILYFYNPALVTSDFHESQIFVIEEGGHRFFAERSTR